MEKAIDPRMHSAEHILNQTMVRMFDSGRCFSAHIEKKKSKLDYRFSRDLTAAEASELEQRANRVIGENLRVTEEFVNREEAGRNYDLSRLPEEARSEKLRIIRIGDYDACPCSGPHVSKTGEIGKLRIISHDFTDGVLRIRYKLTQ